MTVFLTVLHILACVFMIAVILLQRGRGAEIGAVFGAGASGTVFGSRGAGNFLTKATTASAIIFMVTSLSLAYLSRIGGERLEFEDAEQAGAAAPAAAGGGFEEVGQVPAAAADATAAPDPAAAAAGDAANAAPDAPAPKPAEAPAPPTP